jgi:gas vesicle protein
MMKENHIETETQMGRGLSGYMYAFLGGAAIGAVTALLLAPQSGRESREQIRAYARRTGEYLADFGSKTEEAWQAMTGTNGHHRPMPNVAESEAELTSVN